MPARRPPCHRRREVGRDEVAAPTSLLISPTRLVDDPKLSASPDSPRGLALHRRTPRRLAAGAAGGRLWLGLAVLAADALRPPVLSGPGPRCSGRGRRGGRPGRWPGDRRRASP